MSRKFTVSFAESLSLAKRPDADCLLLANGSNSQWDVSVIRFQSREALESFNKKAGLRPVIYTQVPANCAIYRHQSDSTAKATA